MENNKNKIENKDKKNLPLLLLFVAVVAFMIVGFMVHGYAVKKYEESIAAENNYYKNQDVILSPLEEMLQIRKIGKSSAPLKLYVISSFACDYCADFYKNVLPSLIFDYADSGKIEIFFYNIATNEKTLKATMLTKCVTDEVVYHDLSETLYNDQMRWYMAKNIDNALIGYGKMAGLNHASVNACLDDKELLAGVIEQSSEIREKYDITSIPSFVLVRGKRTKIVKSYNELISAINRF